MSSVVLRGDGPIPLVEGLVRALEYARKHDDDFEIESVGIRALVRDGLRLSGDVAGVLFVLESVPGLVVVDR